MSKEFEKYSVEIGSKIAKTFTKKSNKGNAPSPSEINKIIKKGTKKAGE